MGFTTEMVLNGEMFQFCFDNIETTSGMKFFVIAKDQQGNSYSFNMQRNGEAWRIVDAPKVPQTIIENQAALSDVIKKNIET
jgi:hypothetical protein